MPYKFFAFVLLLGFSFLHGCKSAANSSQNNSLRAIDEKTPVIAEINNTPQYKAGFDRFLKSSLSGLEQPSQSDSEVLQSVRLDDYLRRELIIQIAGEKGIQATEEELRHEVSDQHSQSNVEGSADSQPVLAGTERAAEIAKDIVTWKFYKTEILKNVSASPEEIEKYFKDNPRRYPQSPSFCIREIKVDNAQEAEQLRKQVLDKPADFATVANEHSKSPVKGKMYCKHQGELPRELEDAAMPLKVGGISTVYHSTFGYHIFQMVRKDEAQPFEKIRKQVEEDFIRYKNQSIIDKYLDQAVASAKIKVYADKLGFAYAGKYK
jgi:parvulin-like peptidyl-prolyl isomerase